MERIGDIQVNDGGGLFDSAGFVDTIILDCNNTVRQMVSGNYIAFCNGMAEIVKKLGVLKEGISKEKKAMRDEVEYLGKQLDAERSERSAAGSVYHPLDGAVGNRQEGADDAIHAAGCGLEGNPGHAGS